MTKNQWFQKATMSVLLSTSLFIIGESGQAFAATTPQNQIVSQVQEKSTSSSNISDSNSVDQIRENIVTTGKKYWGVPYKFGAEYETSKKFDCSSFTQYVFKENGIKIHRGARDQSKDGVFVKKSDLKPGDLVFFTRPSLIKKYPKNSIKRIGHVGIYIGDGKVVHTYSAKSGGVRIDTIEKGWWDKNYVTARRVIK